MLAQIFVESISVGVLYPVGLYSNPELLERRDDFQRSSASARGGVVDGGPSPPPRSFESYLSVSVGDLCSLVRKNFPADGNSGDEGISRLFYLSLTRRKFFCFSSQQVHLDGIGHLGS